MTEPVGSLMLYKVDHAMEAMNIEGQWAGEAGPSVGQFGDFS